MRWSIEIGMLDAQFPGDGLGFGHDLAHDLRRIGVAGELLERAAGQCADRVERDVAEQLHPDLVTEPRGHRAAEAGGDQRFGDALWLAPTCCRRARRG